MDFEIDPWLYLGQDLLYCLRPLNVHMGLTEQEKKQRGQKLPLSYPNSYPSGWYKLLDSFEIKNGQSKSVECFGKRLILYRDLDGKVICGDMDKNRELVEINMGIFIWFHSNGMTPSWVPRSMLPSNGMLKYHGKMTFDVTCHPQEIAENGADNCHFDVVHHNFSFGFSFLSHGWDPISWIPRDNEKHIVDMELDTWMVLLERFHSVKTRANIQQVGLGTVFIHINIPFFPRGQGLVTIIQTVLPVGPNLQFVSETVYASKWIPRGLAKLYLDFTGKQLKKDIAIWNHKKLLNKPCIVKGDGPILQFRRWAKQFY